MGIAATLPELSEWTLPQRAFVSNFVLFSQVEQFQKNLGVNGRTKCRIRTKF